MSQPPSATRSASSAATVLATTLSNLAIHDRIALAFHVFMLGRVAIAPQSADADIAFRAGLGLLTVSVVSVLLARGEVLRPGKLRSLVYRVGIFFPVVLSYFQLRYLLPALQPVMLDDTLRRLDESLLGITPALWFNRFNTPVVVEWVAFFYYSYFYLMAAMLLPALFLDRGQRLREIMVGAVCVATLGHIGYTFVPGVGPHAAMEFPEPIHGGFFWQQVLLTVESAGAQMDIFPSLHTAYPTLYALHAFGWRRTRPFRWAWPIVAFFALNMIVATMFLRWHWFVDVLAGLALAITARTIAVYVARREAVRDDPSDERQPVWEPLFGSSAKRATD
ncbi:MAG: phosphatase PAP2 family protein [Sandaracinus sp.]|nr:phosphatase PAP2 family protein [Sandaracinus sp.]